MTTKKNNRVAEIHEDTKKVLSQKMAAYLRKFGITETQQEENYNEQQKPLGYCFSTLTKVKRFHEKPKYVVAETTVGDIMQFFELKTDADYWERYGIFKHVENE